ncbi:MAG: ATP-binding protein [Planctomycetota bacterium]
MTLATNPFATRYVRPGALAYRFGVDRPDRDCLRELANRLRDRGGGSILGPHGTGKSTLLHNLHEHYEQRGAVVLHFRLTGGNTKHRWRQQAGLWKDLTQSYRVHRDLPSQRLSFQLVVMIDGAEQLSPVGWYAIRQRCRYAGSPLIATAHRRLAGLICQHRTEVNPSVLQEVANCLLQQGTVWNASARHKWITRWDWQSVSNARDQWSVMYDAIARDPTMSTNLPSEHLTCQLD